MADRTLSYNELSTILAALRLAQQNHDELVEMDHFTDAEPLTVEEIDELCEAINSGDIDGFDI